jgi:hypothetical protein
LPSAGIITALQEALNEALLKLRESEAATTTFKARAASAKEQEEWMRAELKSAKV